MLVSDRCLVALGQFFKEELPFEVDVRVRDWSGTKGEKTLILEGDEPEEHETLDGVYEMTGEICLRLINRDESDRVQRDELGMINEALCGEAMEWVNDSGNSRGLDFGEGFRVYDLRSDDGVWEVDDKWLDGKIAFNVVMAGEDA